MARASSHQFSKQVVPDIRLIAGIGVEGDAHAGVSVKHRSRVKADAAQPNLRQVHLIHCELFDELAAAGFDIVPGELGENVTTRGIDLLSLPRGTRLTLGTKASIEVTGLRNPCVQLDRFQPGLMRAVIDRGENGEPRFKAGIMGVVLADGEVTAGDPIRVRLPPTPHRPLTIV